jgi:D-glycero-D-manno-heptose 1,7-bisphosphate phosphatase
VNGSKASRGDGARRRALFLDRDGTLILDRHYIKEPADVELLPGVGAALRRFVEAGYAPVVITNQSGIARGMLTESDYDAVDARMDDLLAHEGVTLAGAYHCPHHPDFLYRGVARCECRKPGAKLHHQAIAALGLDPEFPVFIGDRWRDLEPSSRLGAGQRILVPSENTPIEDIERATREAQVASDLGAAASLVLDPRKA